jgi:nitrite reductase/ring-hydroxylating ferredoxin subunit
VSGIEVRVCREQDLVAGKVIVVAVGDDDRGRPITALVLRDSDGAPVAYRNLCRHLPVPLDGGTGELLSEDGTYLVCGTHGACYRLHDGLCVEGPCKGLALYPLGLRRRGHDLYVSSASDR